jgi:DNA-binding response OmpR family regulator
VDRKMRFFQRSYDICYNPARQRSYDICYITSRQCSLNKTVLLVDDNIDLQTVLSIGLAPHGFQVLTCSTAAEAIAAIESTPVDVAIIDLELPDMPAGQNGVELGKQIRQHPRGADARLILFSGQHSGKLAQLAADAGFDDYLVKPVPMEQLLEKLLPSS